MIEAMIDNADGSAVGFGCRHVASKGSKPQRKPKLSRKIHILCTFVHQCFLGHGCDYHLEMKHMSSAIDFLPDPK